MNVTSGFYTSVQGRTKKATFSLAAIIVCLDFLIARNVWDDFWGREAIRYVIAIVGVVTLAKLLGKNLRSLGFRLQPKQSWMYWLRVAVGMLILVGVACLATWFSLRHLGRSPSDIFWKAEHKSWFWAWWLPVAGVTVPLVEELIYRVILVNVLVSQFKPSVVIVIGGLCFGLLHVVYGGLEPESLIGGFIITWAFLKSESLLVPLLFHIGGNLAAGLIHYPFG